MEIEKNILEAVRKLRENDKKERKFDQTVDLIINLKEFDVRKQSFNIFVSVPNKVKNKKIAGFFDKKSSIIDTIKKDDFSRYKDKKDVKKLVNSYDFFVSNAKLMPLVATSFGRFLGPASKMPSPQLGILPNEEEAAVKSVIERVNKSVRVRVKEPSVKVGIGKKSLSDEQITQNALAVYNKILENLPRGLDNVKNIEIKFTMSKPIGIEIK